jgi:hypothetical protein
LIATTLPVCNTSSIQLASALIIQGAAHPAAAVLCCAVLCLPPDLFMSGLKDAGKGATTQQYAFVVLIHDHGCCPASVLRLSGTPGVHQIGQPGPVLIQVL